MRRLTWALALFALSVLTTACEREPDASSRSAPVASIATDKGDYPPGHLVTFTGRGWSPGEAVKIVLQRTPRVHDDEVLTSVADASGTVTNTDFRPAQYDLGVRFQVTATGALSGRRAEWTFTDAAITWTGAVSTEWNLAGNWSSGTVPGTTDDMTIPANVASGRYPVVSTANANAKTLTLATGAGTQPSLTVSANTLTIGGNFLLNAGTVTHSGGTIAVTAGSTSISGTFNETGGTYLGAVTLAIATGGVVTVSGTGIVHMASAIGTNPTDDITIAAGATMTQTGGTVNVKAFITTAGTPNGTYNQSGGTFSLYHDFKSSGTFNGSGGTVAFKAAGGGATWPASTGPTQFNNVVCDANPGIDANGAISVSVSGNWTSNVNTDISARATTITLNGTGTQTISGAGTITLANVVVNKASGSATLARNVTVTGGNLSATAGTLDLASFTMNRSTAGGTITVSNGAFLRIGGTGTWPTNYTTATLGATSTVEYYGTNQTVAANAYGHLTLSGSGTKTMPGTAMVIAGNFTMSGTASATAAQALTVNGNVTLGIGTSFDASTFSHAIKGNFSNSGTFTASSSTVTLNGTSAQVISGSTSTTFSALTIDNASGVSLSSIDVTVNGAMTFTSGRVTTGANRVSLGASGSVSRTSGHVVGNFRKNVATGATTRAFEIGDASNYTPVSVVFASVTVAGDLTATNTVGDHPNITGATLNSTKSVNRYWTLTNGGVTFTTYSATFTFVAGDVDGGANTASFTVGRYASSAWSYPTVGTKTATTTQITGASTFGDFALAEVAYQLSGNVFEDVNYGGGAGRSKATASGLGRSGARVELYTSAGVYSTFATTAANGDYIFYDIAPGTWYVRTLNASVTSSRTGYTASALPVQTYKTDASAGSAAAVTNEVGGINPAATAAGNGSSGATFNTSTYVFTAVLSGTAQSVSPTVVASAHITGLDFGYNFDVVVNTNDTGPGSLRQFLANANLLGGDVSLAQSGLVAGRENAVFMIGNGTSAAGLRSAVNYFSSGVATFSPASVLPSISTPMVLDAQKQPGWSSAPIIELNGTSAGASNNGLTITGGATVVRGFIINRFSNHAIHLLTAGADTVQANYIGTNAAGTAASANGGNGIYIDNIAGTLVGGTAAGTANLISGNTGVGVRVSAGTGNAILTNAIYSNGGIGIDLGTDNVTANNGTKNGSLPNSDMDAPVFTSVLMSGTTLTVTGYVGSAASQATFASARVELFKSDNDASGFGEGRAYLGFVTADASGNISGSLTVSGFSVGDKLTGTATDASSNTSEFGANVTSAAAVPLMLLGASVSPSGTQLPATDLTFTSTYTNAGTLAATSVVITDPVPANTDFKVGSATQSLGTTGLSVIIAYSSNGGTTWAYSPTSAGGGAPAGYDRLVTHVKWTFTGNLSPTSPNNAGTVGFVVRIR